MKELVLDSFLKLENYCESQNFKGWDPYDGLNSGLIKATPLKHWDLFRFAWIQTFKRNPINLRKVFLVPKEYNAKGVALLLNSYCNFYKYSIKVNSRFIEQYRITEKIALLGSILLSMQSEGYSGACWGYNFDWQGRKSFLFPKNTPTVVVTSFCVEALLNAYEITGEQNYLDVALTSPDFVLNDLNRTHKKRGFIFSYAPLSGNNVVYNASLLGSKLLSLCYKHTNNEEHIKAARKSVLACADAQKDDGSWIYGEHKVQGWIDSFHTAYNLEAISAYQKYSLDHSFEKNIDKGFEYYISNFFEDKGRPKYYNNKTYPIDIHCPAQLFVTLKNMDRFKEHEKIAEKVLGWTIKNMQHKKGYFYYQKNKRQTNKIPYMRWSNAFMLNALSYYLMYYTLDKKIQ